MGILLSVYLAQVDRFLKFMNTTVASGDSTTMNQSVLHQKDIPSYWKLVALSREQLAAISERLSNKSGRLDAYKFRYRNLRIKKIILKVLNRKQSRVGEQALAELMDDFRIIESDETDWQDARKEELDYIRMMVHGLRDVTEDEE